MEESDSLDTIKQEDLMVVLPYDGDMDDRALEELQPSFIILYDTDPTFIRRIEVYRSSCSSRQVRVYFVYYGGSVEEQRYLSAVRREKDAFTRLINEKAGMAVTLTLDGFGVEDPQEAFLRTVNTRIAGGGRLQATAEPPRVIVDVREFRSSLPSLLHGRQMIVIPCTLTVGDYILSPTMCVERKSVKDLIQSFSNGRLYTQCETMMQHYRTPMLLIEFEQNKSFNLEPFADLSSTINSTDLQSKISLLVLTFPRLKIVWSSNPYQTAEIFGELKKNNDEPDPLKAIAIGIQDHAEMSRMLNQTSQDVLRTMAGITVSNHKNIAFGTDSLNTLSNLDESRMIELIGPEAGRQLYRYINKDLREA